MTAEAAECFADGGGGFDEFLGRGLDGQEVDVACAGLDEGENRFGHFSR